MLINHAEAGCIVACMIGILLLAFIPSNNVEQQYVQLRTS